MQNENQNKTIHQIIWQKCLDFFESNSLKNIGKLFAMIAFIFTLTAFMLNPAVFIAKTMTTMAWKAYFAPKFALSVLIVSNYHLIAKRLLEANLKPLKLDNIEGIPYDELLHHLFTESSLKFSAKKKFNLSHSRFNALVRKLESISILIRGENNSRILNPEFSREQIASILKGIKKADDLEMPIRIFRSGEPMIPTLDEKKKFIAVECDDEDETEIPILSNQISNPFQIKNIA